MGDSITGWGDVPASSPRSQKGDDNDYKETRTPLPPPVAEVSSAQTAVDLAPFPPPGVIGPKHPEDVLRPPLTMVELPRGPSQRSGQPPSQNFSEAPVQGPLQGLGRVPSQGIGGPEGPPSPAKGSIRSEGTRNQGGNILGTASAGLDALPLVHSSGYQADGGTLLDGSGSLQLPGTMTTQLQWPLPPSNCTIQLVFDQHYIRTEVLRLKIPYITPPPLSPLCCKGKLLSNMQQLNPSQRHA